MKFGNQHAHLVRSICNAKYMRRWLSFDAPLCLSFYFPRCMCMYVCLRNERPAGQHCDCNTHRCLRPESKPATLRRDPCTLFYLVLSIHTQKQIQYSVLEYVLCICSFVCVTLAFDLFPFPGCLRLSVARKIERKRERGRVNA